jgi:uncharacterized protein (TIGR03067 family)
MRIIQSVVTLGLLVSWMTTPPSRARSLTQESTVRVGANPRVTLVAQLVQAVDDTKSSGREREIARHRGTWLVTSFVSDGTEATPEIVGSIRRVVKGDHVIWERDGKRFAGTTMELDHTREPKTIDVVPDGGKSRGKRVLGIYKLDGDILTICMAQVGQDRPMDFEARKGRGRTSMTFKREQSGR